MLEQVIAQLQHHPHPHPHQPAARAAKYEATLALQHPEATLALGHVPRPSPTIVRSHAQASGAITCMSMDRCGSPNEFNILVGACCNQQPEYNRTGELQWLTGTGVASVTLDGHCVGTERRTVSSIAHGGTLFHSAGFDGYICGWTRENAFAKAAYRQLVSAKPVLDVAVSADLVFFGTAAGQLGVLNAHSLAVDMYCTLPSASRTGVNWVDVVEVCDRHVLASVGWHSGNKAGALEAWDIATQTLCSSVVTLPGGLGLSAFDCGPDLLAVASGSVLQDSACGDGIIRLFDKHHYSWAFNIHSPHTDVDCVAQSRCGRFLAVGDAIDHHYSVFDLCYPRQPLFASNCCATRDVVRDDPVCLAFTQHGNLLAGGNDSFLYEVDLGEARVVHSTLMASSITFILPVDDHTMTCTAVVGSEGGAVEFVGFHRNVHLLTR